MFFTPLRVYIVTAFSWVIRIASKKPPNWLNYGVYWFRLGICLFLLVSLSLSLVGCISTNSQWRKASGIIPPDLIVQVISENSRLSPEEGKDHLWVWIVQGRDSELYLFYFNHSNLCGEHGCLYSGYEVSKKVSPKRVLAAYFHPNLPKGIPLVSVSSSKKSTSSSSASLPCLSVNQAVAEQSIRQIEYCQQDNRYRQVSESLIQTKN